MKSRTLDIDYKTFVGSCDSSWHWSPGTVQALAQELPSVSHLIFRKQILGIMDIPILQIRKYGLIVSCSLTECWMSCSNLHSWYVWQDLPSRESSQGHKPRTSTLQLRRQPSLASVATLVVPAAFPRPALRESKLVPACRSECVSHLTLASSWHPPSSHLMRLFSDNEPQMSRGTKRLQWKIVSILVKRKDRRREGRKEGEKKKSVQFAVLPCLP